MAEIPYEVNKKNECKIQNLFTQFVYILHIMSFGLPTVFESCCFANSIILNHFDFINHTE